MTTASSGDAGSLGIKDSFRTKYRPGGHSFGPLERAGEAKSTSVTDATPAAPRRTRFARLCRAWIFIMSWSPDQLSTDGTYDLRTRRSRRRPMHRGQRSPACRPRQRTRHQRTWGEVRATVPPPDGLPATEPARCARGLARRRPNPGAATSCASCCTPTSPKTRHRERRDGHRHPRRARPGRALVEAAGAPEAKACLRAETERAIALGILAPIPPLRR